MVWTNCYIGGRCSCRFVELKWGGIWFVATDLAKCRVDEVRVRDNYSIGIRKKVLRKWFLAGKKS